MNVFVLEKDPYKVPRLLSDIHLNKMLIEALQLLSTNERLNNRGEDGMYKVTHKNHPCRISLSNNENVIWLSKYVSSSLEEWSFRFGKKHGCSEIYEKFFKKYESLRFSVEKITFPKCMDEQYKIGGNNIDDVIRSYRKYYKFKKETIKRWKYTNREEPRWLN